MDKPMNEHTDSARESRWTTAGTKWRKQVSAGIKQSSPFWVSLVLPGGMDTTLCTFPDKGTSTESRTYEWSDGHQSVIEPGETDPTYLNSIHGEYIDFVKGYMTAHDVGILEYGAFGNSRHTVFTNGALLSLSQRGRISCPTRGNDRKTPVFGIDRLKLIEPGTMEEIAWSASQLGAKKSFQMFQPPTAVEELQYICETVCICVEESGRVIVRVLKKYLKQKGF
jgi:hypothetical protein